MSAKNKLAYFKDNIAGGDEDDFDASQYYYNRGDGPDDSNGDADRYGGEVVNPSSNSGFNGGIFGNGGGVGSISQPNSMTMGQRSASSSIGGAPGLSMAGSAGMTTNQSAINQYPPNVNGMGALRSTSAPSGAYPGSQDQSQTQDRDLFALLNKGGNAGGGITGSSSGNGMGSGGISSGNGSGSISSIPGGGPNMLSSNTSSIGSSEVGGLSMMPGGGSGGDGLSMATHGIDGNPSFDINEFPALGGAPGTGRVPASMMGVGGGNFGAYPDSSQSSEFTSMMSEESFPSLPGQDGLGGGGGSGGGEGTDSKQTQYGLLGLLSVIRMMDADLNTLALGSDLTTLGLNLNSAKCLYSTFSSPWSDGPSKSDPQFTLPSCYHMATPPPLKHAHLHKFQLETLFYVFYAMPKDLLQAYAGQELYHRDWRYHAELKLWFRRATQQDLPHLPADRASTQYIFFDINSWECRLFNGNTHIVSTGLMSEEEIRVRVPST